MFLLATTAALACLVAAPGIAQHGGHTTGFDHPTRHAPTQGRASRTAQQVTLVNEHWFAGDTGVGACVTPPNSPFTFPDSQGCSSAMQPGEGVYCPPVDGACGDYHSPSGDDDDVTQCCCECPNGCDCSENYYSPCAPGTYNGGTQVAPCSGTRGTCCDCVAGYLCAVGSASATPSSMDPSSPNCCGMACPVGFYCPNATMSKPCPARWSSLEASTVKAECQPCPSGTYTVGQGGPCLKCNAGRVGCRSVPDCTAPPGPNCSSPCPLGRWCPAGTAWNSSLPCRAGYFCPVGTAAPLPCTPGYYCVMAATSMRPCPSGTVCRRGSAKPLQCPGGHYCPEKCSVPQPCRAGYWCAPGSASETPCSAGNWCAANATKQTPCKARTYCPGGSPAPKQCPGGHYCPEKCSVPQPCGAGYWCAPGSASETPCSAGNWCTANATKQTPCKAGTYCPGGSPAPKQCPVASYCPPSSAVPTPCPAGRFGPTRGLRSATACPPCLYGTACGRGTFSPGPSVPQGFHINCAPNATLLVEWSPAGNGGGVEFNATVVEYTAVVRAGADGALVQTIDVPVVAGLYTPQYQVLDGQMSVRTKELVAGSVYNVSLRARNNVGAAGVVARAPLAQALVLPSAPRNLTVQPAVGAVFVSWAQCASGGGADVTSLRYTVWLYACASDRCPPDNTGAPAVRTVVVPLGEQSTSIAGISASRQYRVSIAAANDLGASVAAWSAPVQPLSTPPGVLSVLRSKLASPVIIAGCCGCVLLLAFAGVLDRCHRNVKPRRRHFVPLFFLWSAYHVFGDVSYTVLLFNSALAHGKGHHGVHTATSSAGGVWPWVLAWAYFTFTVVPFFVNAVLVTRLVRHMMRDQPAFLSWRLKHSGAFFAVSLAACFKPGSFGLIGCSVAGLKCLSAPPPAPALGSWFRRWTLITSLAEDIPQLGLLLVSARVEHVALTSVAAALSLSSSCLSLGLAVVRLVWETELLNALRASPSRSSSRRGALERLPSSAASGPTEPLLGLANGNEASLRGGSGRSVVLPSSHDSTARLSARRLPLNDRTAVE